MEENVVLISPLDVPDFRLIKDFNVHHISALITSEFEKHNSSCVELLLLVAVTVCFQLSLGDAFGLKKQ